MELWQFYAMRLEEAPRVCAASLTLSAETPLLRNAGAGQPARQNRHGLRTSHTTADEETRTFDDASVEAFTGRSGACKSASVSNGPWKAMGTIDIGTNAVKGVDAFWAGFQEQ